MKYYQRSKGCLTTTHLLPTDTSAIEQRFKAYLMAKGYNEVAQIKVTHLGTCLEAELNNPPHLKDFTAVKRVTNYYWAMLSSSDFDNKNITENLF